jgi:hypothetical protein
MRAILIGTAFALLTSAAAALAQQPTQAQVTAIKQACRSDYQSYCSSVPTGGSAALQCLQTNAASLSAPCNQALNALNGGTSSGMNGPGAGTAPYHPAPATMSRRQQMMALRADCGPDFRRFCGGVQPGGGRAVVCLYAYGPQLSQVCHSALQSR